MALSPALVAEGVRLGAIEPWDTARFLTDPPPALQAPVVDPFDALDADAREELVLRMAASGAPADLPPRTVAIGDRRVKYPPAVTRRPNRPPRARRPRQETTP